MIHRDLKIENIMLNCIFESKIIDLDLAHVSEGIENLTLSKGVGTIDYMSPEMLNDQDYDNKTDVYSYGIVLFALFTGKLPNQSFKEKSKNTRIKMPQPSEKISKYCIEFNI